VRSCPQIRPRVLVVRRLRKSPLPKSRSNGGRLGALRPKRLRSDSAQGRPSRISSRLRGSQRESGGPRSGDVLRLGRPRTRAVVNGKRLSRDVHALRAMWLSAIPLVVIAEVACGTESGPSRSETRLSSEASCRSSVEVGGLTYFAVAGTWKALKVSTDSPVDATESASCAPRGEPGRRVRLFGVEGVPTRIALAPATIGESLFVAPGTFVPLPEHPLHDAEYGAPTRPDLTRGRRCGGRAAVSVRVIRLTPLGQGMRVQRGTRKFWLRIDVNTRFVGLGRPIPRVRENQRLAVEYVRCRGTNRRTAKHVRRA
jgi:hypothetical protein